MKLTCISNYMGVDFSPQRVSQRDQRSAIPRHSCRSRPLCQYRISLAVWHLVCRSSGDSSKGESEMRRLISMIFFNIIVHTMTFGGTDELIEKRLCALRGKWEFHTFEERFLIEFTSDHEFSMNRREMWYWVNQSTIHYRKEGEFLYATYHLDADRLTITYQSGEVITYKRQGFGRVEGELHDVFYQSPDSDSPTCIAFHKDQRFTFQSGNAPRRIRWGSFRIDEDRVKLLFDDGEIQDALVGGRDNDGVINVISVLNTNYKKRTESQETIFDLIVHILNTELPRLPRDSPEGNQQLDVLEKSSGEEATASQGMTEDVRKRHVRNSGNERASGEGRVRP